MEGCFYNLKGENPIKMNINLYFWSSQNLLDIYYLNLQVWYHKIFDLLKSNLKMSNLDI